MVVQTFQDKAQVLFVLRWGCAGYKKIIDVCVAGVESLEYLIDEPLECLSCIVQHPQELKQAEGGGDGSLGDIC